MKLVIKGAYYYEKENDRILVPHFTGEFSVVDCSIFIKMDDLKDLYSKEYIDQVKDDPIEFEGEKYYKAEYSPEIVGDWWKLLSNLSNLEHTEEEYDW